MRRCRVSPHRSIRRTARPVRPIYGQAKKQGEADPRQHLPDPVRPVAEICGWWDVSQRVGYGGDTDIPTTRVSVDEACRLWGMRQRVGYGGDAGDPTVHEPIEISNGPISLIRFSA